MTKSKCIYCGAPDLAHNANCSYVAALEKGITQNTQLEQTLTEIIKTNWGATFNLAEMYTDVCADRDRLADLLEQSKISHYHVEEDCWYCCPSCEDYCGDEPAGVCQCIADEWNAKVDAALAPAPAELAVSA